MHLADESAWPLLHILELQLFWYLPHWSGFHIQVRLGIALYFLQVCWAKFWEDLLGIPGLIFLTSGLYRASAFLVVLLHRVTKFW